MLSFFRTAAQSRIFKVMFGLLIASFALWGVGPILHSGNHLDTAAKVGNVKITSAEAERALEQGLRRLESQLGQLPPREIIDQVIRPQMLSQMVNTSLFEQEARAIGIRVGKELLQQSIAAEPGFRGEDGKFNKERYHTLLQTVGLAEADYLRSLQQDIGQSALQGIVAAAAEPSPEMIRLVERHNGEKRVVDAVYISADSIKDVPAATEEELKKFYDTHAERYRAPEYRSFSYVFADIKNLREAVTITDDELRKAYDDNPADYTTPEKRDVALVTVDDKAKAEKIAADAAANGLDAAAKSNGNVIVKKMADVGKTDVLPALADIVFSTDIGKPSAAVQTPLGWHVLAVTKITPSHKRSFEEALTDIKQRLTTQKTDDAVGELARQIEDYMAGGATLKEAAEKFKLPLTSVENVTQAGLKLDGSKITDKFALDNVMSIAFATAAGDNSAVHDVPNGLMALHVDTVIESQIKPFAEVKEQVQKGQRLARQAELAEARAKELAAKGDFSGASSIGPISRDGNGRGKLPVQGVAKIFELTDGQPGVAIDEGGTWAVRLKKLVVDEPTENEIKLARENLLRVLSTERHASYARALWRQYAVEIDGKPAKPPAD